MHSGKPQNGAEEMMTLSPHLPCDPSLLTSQPSSDANRPFELVCPPSDALPKIRSKSKGNGLPDVTKPHYNLLPNKLRLNKILKNETARSIAKAQQHSDEDGRSEIRVLSPSIVNSQVLPRTRPLSPENVQLPVGLQDENKDTTIRAGWKDENSRRNEAAMKDTSEAEKEQESSKGKGKGKRRQRLFKLKFHHQALPPEYLDHYEASLRQQNKVTPKEPTGTELQSGLRQGPRNKVNNGARGSRPITIHQAGNGATEALLRDLLVSNPRLQQVALQQAAIARAQSVPSVMLATGHNSAGLYPVNMPPPSPAESMCADDQLSYASDMSIDECPRRGRNSRKNSTSSNKFGRGLGGAGLGTLGAACSDRMSSNGSVNEVEPVSLVSQYAMLEKQALARSRSYSSLINHGDQHEPLNLCIRDGSKDYGYDDNRFNVCGIKTEPDANLEDTRGILGVHKDDDLSMQSPCITPHDYPSWPYSPAYFPGNPQWLHDYRLKTEDGLSSGHSTPSVCSQSSHMPCLSPPVWPHFSPPPYSPSPLPPMSPLTPPHHSRHMQNLIKDSLHHRHNDEGARERFTPRDSCIRSPSRPTGISSSFRLSSLKGGARRKRSALFIPPADPNTEVSICKFKFTGGANPLLEEKKMISVDAGGTLRYFSNGDNFTSKETNVKFSGKMLESLSKCAKDVKKIRLESDTDETCSLPGGGLDNYSTTTSPAGRLEDAAQATCTTPSPIEDSPKRKRRSKKSSVREKLEQTLREKGLLIQTQQVESAEGATYCKFRQLRKITRYLFRSWKDYLPGQVHDEMNPDGHREGPAPYYHGGNIHEPNIDRQQLPTYHR